MKEIRIINVMILVNRVSKDTLYYKEMILMIISPSLLNANTYDLLNN